MGQPYLTERVISAERPWNGPNRVYTFEEMERFRPNDRNSIASEETVRMGKELYKLLKQHESLNNVQMIRMLCIPNGNRGRKLENVLNWLTYRAQVWEESITSARYECGLANREEAPEEI